MTLRIALFSSVLLACGSLGDLADPRLDEPTPPWTPEPPAIVIVTDVPTDRDAGADSSVADSGAVDSSSPPDSSPDADLDAGDEADAACVSEPTIGHCLTHMATLCYETSFDDTEACARSGMSSRWHLGPCDLRDQQGRLRANAVASSTVSFRTRTRSAADLLPSYPALPPKRCAKRLVGSLSM